MLFLMKGAEMFVGPPVLQQYGKHEETQTTFLKQALDSVDGRNRYRDAFAVEFSKNQTVHTQTLLKTYSKSNWCLYVKEQIYFLPKKNSRAPEFDPKFSPEKEEIC